MSDFDPTTRAQIEAYVSDKFAPEDDVLRWIQSEADKNDMPKISVKPFDGRLLQFLMVSVGVHKAVEVGSLAGYSATWIARALPEDGKLWTLEKSSKHAKVALASLERAGVSHKVHLLEGSALDLMKNLTPEGPFDFVFIDADKSNYLNYYQWAVQNLRPGGMVAAHNAFRAGKIFSPKDEDDRIMADFNETLSKDPRVEAIILPIGDGMAAAVKKR